MDMQSISMLPTDDKTLQGIKINTLFEYTEEN